MLNISSEQDTQRWIEHKVIFRPLCSAISCDISRHGIKWAFIYSHLIRNLVSVIPRLWFWSLPSPEKNISLCNCYMLHILYSYFCSQASHQLSVWYMMKSRYKATTIKLQGFGQNAELIKHTEELRGTAESCDVAVWVHHGNTFNITRNTVVLSLLMCSILTLCWKKYIKKMTFLSSQMAWTLKAKTFQSQSVLG